MSKPLDVRKFVEGVHSYLAKAFSPINARIAALETRINLLEAQSREFKYLGTWQEASLYVRHNSVTFNGSLWICRAAQTNQRPADSNSDWQLAVRKGRDP